MEKINLVKLLKDCPKGMELNCAMFDGVFLEKVDDDPDYPILITTKEGRTWSLTMNGCWDNTPSAKCIIFPKGKTTWEGFVPLCEFKDGDIVATDSGNWIGITTGGNAHRLIPTYCVIKQNGKFEAYIDIKNKWCFSRLANKNEKQKLFQAIKDNGYRWNTATKTLEKLVEPNFHEGDWVVNKFGDVWHIDSFDSKNYQVSNGEGNYNYFPISKQDEMHIWTINDAKDGDVLVCDINKAEIGGDVEKLPNIVSTIFSFKKVITSRDYIHSYCHLYDRRFLGLQSTMYYNSFVYNISPATKEQRDLLLQKIKETGYKWVI